MDFETKKREFEGLGHKIEVLETFALGKRPRRKIRRTCPEGHAYEMSKENFLRAAGCKVCLVSAAQKWWVEKTNKWLGLGYSSFKKLDNHYFEFVCPVHGLSKNLLLTLKRGAAICRKCYPKKGKTQRSKLQAWEQFKKNVEASGWRILSPCKYGVSVEHLLEDPLGRQHHISPYGWEGGQRFNYTRTLDDIRQGIEGHSYKIYDTKYKNANAKLKMKCPEGHEFQMSYAKWSGGHRCPDCFGSKKWTFEDLSQHPTVLEAKYTLLRIEKIGVGSKAVFLCPKGHEYLVSIPHFLNRHNRCSTCGKSTSKAELDLLGEIKKIYPSAAKNKQHGFEMDIYIPEIKTAVEYCGLFWHSDAHKNARLESRHEEKFLRCRELGIQLITVFEDEFLDKREIVLNRILFRSHQRLFARDTKFEILTVQAANAFFDANHLLGGTKNIKHAFGLFHNEVLVAALTYGAHHRHEKGRGLLVLNRLCFGNFNVLGGTEKLFKNSLEDLPGEKIVTWSDNRWSTGQVYQRLGFVKEADLPPDYSWCKTGQNPCRVNKQQMRLSAEEKPLGLTERELRSQQGWFQIYDCGKIRWVYSIKNNAPKSDGKPE